MKSKLRISVLFSVAVAALSGCETPPGPVAISDKAPQAISAFYSDTPALLFASARNACTGPNEEYIRPAKGVAQCRLLLDPQSTAALILAFDGMIEDLPRLVISLSTAKAPNGHVVSGCAFVMVPQRDGTPLRVAQHDRKIETTLRELLAAVGGQPVRDVPAEVAERCFSI